MQGRKRCREIPWAGSEDSTFAGAVETGWMGAKMLRTAQRALPGVELQQDTSK